MREFGRWLTVLFAFWQVVLVVTKPGESSRHSLLSSQHLQRAGTPNSPISRPASCWQQPTPTPVRGPECSFGVSNLVRSGLKKSRNFDGVSAEGVKEVQSGSGGCRKPVAAGFRWACERPSLSRQNTLSGARHRYVP